MEYIDQSIKIITQHDIMQHVERCGRVCYKSEHKITDGSALRFVRNIANLGHGSVMEHGSLYFKVNNTLNNDVEKQFLKIGKSKYSKMVYRDGYKYIYTNLRVVYEESPEIYKIVSEDLDLPNGVLYFEPEMSDPNRRVTVNIITDRRIETEIVRHRVASFSIESTRYVNYTKKGMIFIDMRKWLTNWRQKFWWKCSTIMTNFFYNRMIGSGCKPQIARSVLSSCNKAEIMMTAYVSDWEHFFELRTVKAAHPMIIEVAKDIKAIFKFNEIIK